MMTNWNSNDHMTTWGWVWMGTGMVLVLAVIVALVVMLLRSSASNRGLANTQPEDAMDILARRYAAGDFDDEEYERRRASRVHL